MPQAGVGAQAPAVEAASKLQSLAAAGPFVAGYAGVHCVYRAVHHEVHCAVVHHVVHRAVLEGRHSP